MNKVILILMCFVSVLGIGFSATCIGTNCGDVESFQEQFENDPAQGFRSNPSGAWNLVQTDPLGVFNDPSYGDSAIDAAYRNNPSQFVDVVSNNLDLMDNPRVREYFEDAVDRDITILNSNPQARERFLADYGITASNYPLSDFNKRTGELQIANEFGEGIIIDVSDLNGGRINSDGTVTLSSQVRIIGGEVDVVGNDIRFGSRGGMAEVRTGEIYTSTQRMSISRFSENGGGFMVDGNEVYFNGNSRLLNGELHTFDNGQTMLGSRTQLRFVNTEGQILEDIRVSSQTLFRDGESCAQSEMSCISRDEGRGVQVVAKNNNRITYDFNIANPDIDFDVMPITDGSRVNIVVPNSDGRDVRFSVGQTMRQSGGVLGSDSEFNLGYYHQFETGDGGISAVPITSYRINGDRVYSIFTGEELPFLPNALNCGVGESCQIGSSSYTRQGSDTFCSSDSKCYNLYGERVSRDGNYYVSGSVSNPQVLGEVEDGLVSGIERSSQSAQVWVQRDSGEEVHPARGGVRTSRDVRSEVFTGTIPIYSADQVPPNYCSRYVRLASEQLFGVSYAAANAWDLDNYHPRTVSFSSGSGSYAQQLYDAYQSGAIRQGDALRLNSMGSRWGYTGSSHVAVVLGITPGGDVQIAHQFGSTYHSETVGSLMARSSYYPVDVLRG